MATDLPDHFLVGTHADASTSEPTPMKAAGTLWLIRLTAQNPSSSVRMVSTVTIRFRTTAVVWKEKNCYALNAPQDESLESFSDKKKVKYTPVISR